MANLADVVRHLRKFVISCGDNSLIEDAWRLQLKHFNCDQDKLWNILLEKNILKKEKGGWYYVFYQKPDKIDKFTC